MGEGHWNRFSKRISSIARMASALAGRHHDALDEIPGAVVRGRREVFDADLKGYFDSIPRDQLMSAVRMRVTDSSVLKLIRLCLDSVVVDEGEGGPPRRSQEGTPQGGVIRWNERSVIRHFGGVSRATRPPLREIVDRF